MGLRKSKSGFLLSDQWKNFKPAGGVFELLTDRAGATFHTVWGHRSCTTRKWRKNANYQFSLSNKDEEVGWEGRFDGEFMRTRIKASFMKHPNCSLPSRPASLDLSLSPLPHTAPWERFQGNCQRGKFNNGVKKSKSTIHMFMFVVGVPAHTSTNGMLALVQWFSIWWKMKLQNLRSQPNSWQKYSLSAMFCLLLQMQFSPKLGALVKWLGIIWVGRPHLVSHKSLVSTSAVLCVAMFTKLVTVRCLNVCASV